MRQCGSHIAAEKLGLSEPAIGEKGEKYMKGKNTRKVNNKGDQPVGRLYEIPDFLPPPRKLISIHRDTVEVTLPLDRQSLRFFKSWAAKLGSKYQNIMREVLQIYVAHYAPRR